MQPTEAFHLKWSQLTPILQNYIISGLPESVLVAAWKWLYGLVTLNPYETDFGLR